MTTQSINPLTEFQWTPQPEAEALVREIVEDFLSRCADARDLAMRMNAETGTRFNDWIDHISLAMTPDLQRRLIGAGYERDADIPPSGAFKGVWVHRRGMFPPIYASTAGPIDIALKAESVADFAAVHAIINDIEGEPLSSFRWLPLVHDEVYLNVVERHAVRHGTDPRKFDARTAIARLRQLEEFRARQREFGVDEEGGFEHAESLVDGSIDAIGRDLTCDLFFSAEREYWMRRNRAAQIQYARQQRLGLGWANHDHHTYRSSRQHFARLIAIWEKLGFVCRERFYAGREAGWGAQVMEHPVTGIVTFNDVDLSPDELLADFAHEPLPERRELGTVGLWCALHGESFLQAGMHHLEAQFDFEALRQQLEAEAGIRTMKPFTDFPHLRQAFTEGERWPVKEDRIARLLANSQITREQAAQFRQNGAIGSHLENLERNAGFKGFNQKGVSEIITATDPRKHS